MKPTVLSILCIFFTCFAAAAPAQGPADELLGQWYTEDDASQVLVEKVNGKYLGHIVWLEEPRYEKGDPEAGKKKHDRKNREKKLQKRPILGLLVLQDFSYDRDDKEWNSGTIYDPEVGKTYKCVIKFQADPQAEGGKSLDVRGYIGFPVLGRTTLWHRVPKDELKGID